MASTHSYVQFLDKLDEYKRIEAEKRLAKNDYDKMIAFMTQLRVIEAEMTSIVENLDELPDDPQLLLKIKRPYFVLSKVILKASQDQVVNLLKESCGFSEIQERPDKNEILRRVLQNATSLEFRMSDVKSLVNDPDVQRDIVKLLGETIDRLNLTDLKVTYDRALRGPEAYQVSLRLFFHPSVRGAKLTPTELDTFMTEKIMSWDDQRRPRYAEYARDILDARVENAEYSAGKLKFTYFPEDFDSVKEVKEYLLKNSLEDGILEGGPGNSAIVPTKNDKEYGFIDYRRENNITVKKLT